MLKYLLEKEFKQLLRDKFMARIIFIMPFTMMLILPLAANMEIKNVNISVVDNDHSPISQRLMDKVAASNYFSLTDISPTYPKALESIGQGRSEIILEIPQNFEQTLTKEGGAEVLITANAVNSTNAILGSSYLSAIVRDYSRELVEQSGATMSPGSGGEAAIINTNVQFKYNPSMNYKAYMVPALMVMLLTIMCAFLPALSVVAEKESGTIEQINVTPVNKGTFILAKLILYWIVGFIVLTISLGIAYFVYGLWPVGSLVTIYVGAMLYIVLISGFGLLISNNSSRMQEAMFVMFFFMIVFILMSGLFTPINSMPKWAQIVTLFDPLRYFIIIIRSAYLKGSGLLDLLPELLSMLVFAIVFNLWAVLSYKKSA